jgi:hypothetical protein
MTALIAHSSRSGVNFWVAITPEVYILKLSALGDQLKRAETFDLKDISANIDSNP